MSAPAIAAPTTAERQDALRRANASVTFAGDLAAELCECGGEIDAAIRCDDPEWIGTMVLAVRHALVQKIALIECGLTAREIKEQTISAKEAAATAYLLRGMGYLK